MERQKYLGVAPYERSSKRQGHANGFKPHTAKTRVGEITLAVPQVREGGSKRGLHTDLAIGIDSCDAMARAALDIRARGFPAIKIKLGTNRADDVTRVRAI